jgi:endonuclease/exonuclease/phosphatase family metal-dependent hydrolase
LALLIRTWNLFHGNAKPPERRAFLERMVQVAAADRPDVLCLQEVPPWALPLLDDWSAMVAVGEVAARPAIGPLPSTAEIGRRLTELHHGVLRSAFSGQANAILLAPALRPIDRDSVVLNPWSFRRVQARVLGLGLVARAAWGKERRVCQVVRVQRPEARPLVVANLHATSYPADQRLADAELLRAAVFVDGFARPDEAVALCGDFNVPLRRSRTLQDLTGREWGFAGATPQGIDQVLVRGLVPAAPVRWPEERRRFEGRLLSDHTPVEVRVG